MDLRLIQKLLRMMTRADVTELEIDDANEGLKVRLRRGAVPEANAAPVVHFMGGGAPVPSSASAPHAGPGTLSAESPPGELPAGAQQILSPMVGTFYRSSSPEADPFVEIGGRVDSEDVICIIEAMKVMNEIKAEVTGEVIEALVENGDPVEFGQPLFLVRTA